MVETASQQWPFVIMNFSESDCVLPTPPCRWEHPSTRHVLAKTFMVYFPANFISICRRSVDFLICTVYHLLNIRKEAQLAERWMPLDCGSLDLLPRSSLEVLDHYFTHLGHCSLTLPIHFSILTLIQKITLFCLLCVCLIQNCVGGTITSLHLPILVIIYTVL